MSLIFSFQFVSPSEFTFSFYCAMIFAKGVPINPFVGSGRQEGFIALASIFFCVRFCSSFGEGGMYRGIGLLNLSRGLDF